MTLKLYKAIMKYISNQIEIIETFKINHDINTNFDEHVLIRKLRKNLEDFRERIEDITEKD